MDNYYKRLGVPGNATPEEIKKRWKDTLKDIHPDVSGETTTDRAAKINEAYMTLRDPEKRQKYDEELSRTSTQNTEGRSQAHESWAGVRRTPPASNPTPPVDNRPIDEKYKEVRQKMDKMNDEVDKRLQKDREESDRRWQQHQKEMDERNRKIDADLARDRAMREGGENLG